MGVGAVGARKRVAVERGAQRHRAHRIDHLEALDVEAHARLEGELALGADDGGARSCVTRRTGSHESSGVKNEDAAARLRKRQLHRGKAGGRVERPAAPRRNRAQVERQRHARALRRHRLGQRDDVDQPRDVPQEFGVGAQGIILRVARERDNLLVAHAAVVVGLALALAVGAARVDDILEQLGEGRRHGRALRLLRLAAQAVAEVHGGVDVGAQLLQLRGKCHCGAASPPRAALALRRRRRKMPSGGSALGWKIEA